MKKIYIIVATIVVVLALIATIITYNNITIKTGQIVSVVDDIAIIETEDGNQWEVFVDNEDIGYVKMIFITHGTEAIEDDEVIGLA